MPGITSQINDFNKDKFQVRFSNVVNMTGYEHIDSHVLNNYVQEFNIPDVSIPMLTSVFGHERQLHPSPIGSRDLQTINILFKIDEHMFNFWLMYAWLGNMRRGKTCGKTDLKGKELLRMDCIDCIELCLLDNDDHLVSKMKFHHCILSNISSLDLSVKGSEIGTMTCTFEYEEMTFDVETEEE